MKESYQHALSILERIRGALFEFNESSGFFSNLPDLISSFTNGPLKLMMLFVLPMAEATLRPEGDDLYH